VAAAFDEPLKSMVEVRNQARVHLWFEGKYGEPYPPLTCSAEAMGRFITPLNSVGVRLGPDDDLQVLAPFGLEDLFALRVRPNPAQGRAERFAQLAANMRRRWPELTVEPAA
jgi:hypothetical protein